MKTLIFTLICLAATATLQSQETHQFSVTIPDNAPNGARIATGTLLLTERHLVVSVQAGLPNLSSGAIHGPAKLGEVAPAIFDFPVSACAADATVCGFEGEADLTEDQIEQLRAGLWYVLLNGTYRGQVLFTGTCRFQESSPIRLASFIDGWDPTNSRPRQIRWGRASFGLTGNNLSYELSLPLAYRHYYANIARTAVSPDRGQRLFSLGTLRCEADVSSNTFPDASGLELTPRCTSRGALCVPDALIPQLLAGEWQLRLIGNSDPIPGGWTLWGNILPVDSDHDGIPDFRDSCPNTASGAVVSADGCSIEQLCPCDRPWKNHGEFVNCMKQATAEFVNAGLITAADRRLLINRATASDCGKRR